MSSETETPTTHTAEDILRNTAAPKVGDMIEIDGVRSQFGGAVTFAATDVFANVIGSTGDRPIDNLAWIRLWERTYNTTATQCSSFGFPTVNNTPFPCTTNLIGGHVIKGQTASVVPPGSNDVYIIPICQKHNKNNNVFMSPVTERRAVWLKNYHNP